MTYQFGDVVLNKFKIEIILGQGSYGDLYRVSRNDGTGIRAIKVFNRNDYFKRSISYENVKRRFMLEAHLGKQLNTPKPNPYLLHVFDFVETKDELFLEMEYAEAGNLSYRISEYRSKGIPFQRDRALRIAYEISAGLSSLHSKGIVHRNLKPANILFNSKDQVLLADLGFAQLPEEPGSRTRLGYTNVYPISGGYSSPEQLLSSDILSPASDIYTLGLILFEMLTGKIFSSVGPRTRLSDLIPDVRYSLDELMVSMLSDSPSTRPMDGKEVALQLIKESEAEELVQYEIQAKKRREMEEWERLKNSELAKEKLPEQPNRIKPQITKANIEEKEKQLKPASPNPIGSVWQAQEVKNVDTQPVSSCTAISEKEIRSISKKTTEKSHSKPLTMRKYFVIGGLLIFSVAAISLLTVFIKGQPITESMEQAPFETPVSNISTQQGPLTENMVNDPVEQTAVSPIISTIESSNPVQNTPLVLTSSGQPTAGATPIFSKGNLLNPGFEEDLDWILRVGDDHILGKYSSKWASEGSRSYQISLFGNRVYEYCFTPGMRTTVNQTVDLTGVKEIWFDINILSPKISDGFHGDVIRNEIIGFIDTDQVYSAVDDTKGEFRDQRIRIYSRYPGKHDLKFGLMVKSKYCVKGVTEEESLLLFIDNIRLVIE